MSSMIPLQALMADYGYPRPLFINSSKVYSKQFDSGNLDYNNEFYVIKNNNATYAVMKSKDCKLSEVATMSYSHLYNSIAKYIILVDIELDLKINMILYILYYTSIVNGSSTISDIEITEGVILHISNIIKLMIEKEHTLYRDCSYIGEAIEELRQSLLFERAHTNWRQKINLRR